MPLRHISIILVVSLCMSSASYADYYSKTRSNRQMAATTCNDYRENNRLPCFVSRTKCPRGFELIQSFSDHRGASFVACRDSRHERPPHLNHSRWVNRDKLLLQQFDQLVDQVKKKQIGKPLHLAKSTRYMLNTFFSPLQLDKIAIFRSEALSSGCFTDCQQIYCSANEQLDHWADPNAPISIHLLHQLAHVERCEILGGRNRFVLAWLKYVPEEVLTNLKQGNPIDTDQLQYTMYVEGHTKNRSESICHHIHCVQE
jgi:hypothetical protein